MGTSATRFEHSSLRIEHLGTRQGRVWYRLTSPLRVTWEVNGAHKLGLTVPAGFETDFASIPRALWWLFPPDGQWAPIAVVHDWLYQQGLCSRFLADAIFRDGMAGLGVPVDARVVMFYAVRLWGWRHFRKQKEGT